MSATANHGRIKLPSARVPGEGHFGGGACYTKASPLFPRTHTAVVITQFPLRSTLRSTNYVKRIAKWGTVLGAFDIKYMPRTSVKGLVLVGLVARFAESPLKKEAENQGMDENSVGIISLQKLLFWKEYIDIFKFFEAVKQNLNYVGSSDLLLWGN